jgi:hypothetical protein
MANWHVPLITQKAVKLCWEACGRMMWRWHFKNLNGYASKAGNYSKLDKGLIEEEMNVFCFEATRPAWKGVSFLPNEPPGIIRASYRA